MEHNHDFKADNQFFIDNYGTLLNLYAGKSIAVAQNRVLFVADSGKEVVAWSYKFGMAGNCSVLDVTPQTYVMLTEGIRI